MSPRRTLDQLFVAYGEEVLARQFHEQYENGDDIEIEDCCDGSIDDHREAAAKVIEEAEARFVPLDHVPAPSVIRDTRRAAIAECVAALVTLHAREGFKASVLDAIEIVKGLDR